jgi:hypothetical protein
MKYASLGACKTTLRPLELSFGFAHSTATDLLLL